MVKGKELPSLPTAPSPANKSNNAARTAAAAPEGEQVLTDLSKNLNADSQLQFRNNSALGVIDQKQSKERNVSSLKSQAKKSNISVQKSEFDNTTNNMSEMANNYQVSFDYKNDN